MCRWNHEKFDNEFEATYLSDSRNKSGLEQLFSADEVFLTNSIQGVRWVASIEDSVFQQQKVSQQLVNQINQLIKNGSAGKLVQMAYLVSIFLINELQSSLLELSLIQHCLSEGTIIHEFSLTSDIS